MHIALAQIKPVLTNTEKNLNLLITSLEESKQKGAEVVLFPEMSLTGYLQNKKDIENLSLSIDSPAIQKLSQTCQKLAVDAVFSFPEKDSEGYFITAIYVDATGHILSKYRKTHLFDEEKTAFSHGSDYPVFTTAYGKVGIMICYDLEFPETARLLRAKGAEIILIPTANMSPYEKHQDVYLMSRAMENEIPLAISNQIGTDNDLHFFGHSKAVDLNGETIVEGGETSGISIGNISIKTERDPKLNYLDNINKKIYQSLEKYLK